MPVMSKSAMRTVYIAVLVSVIIFSFFTPAMAVKKEDFKSSSQSSFYRRSRAYAEYVTKNSMKSPYTLQKSSMSFEQANGVVRGIITNSLRKVDLSFELSGMNEGTVRVKISEKNPLKPRLNIVDSIVMNANSPTQKSFTKLSDNEKSVTLRFAEPKNSTVTITYDPFKLDFEVDGVHVLTVNERGYLRFEEQRKKPESSEEGATDAAKKGEKTELDKIDDDGAWEETFKSWTDSKPRGPTAVAMDFTFPGFSHIYGIPEHADDFNLKSTKGDGAPHSEPYRLYNLDVFEYILESEMALYGSVPFVMAHKGDRSVGLLWLNPSETWVDVERSSAKSSLLSKILPGSSSTETSTKTHWISESNDLDFFVFLGPAPAQVHQQYMTLSGTSYLPPLFSVAYHQCRWNYLNTDDVSEVDGNFDRFDIPYDVLWLDIEHTDGKRYFTWDSSKFGEPEVMQANLTRKGRKMVTIIDPHIKDDTGYYISSEASTEKHFVKDSAGYDYRGWCWPGNSHWVDFLSDKAREWWASKFKLDTYKGSTLDLYTWNDMNEPSVFSGPEITMPKDNLHAGDWEHRDVHNLYGMLQHRASHEGHLARSNNQRRPFVLSRAFFVGTQRYGPIWTGDNMAKWDHLAAATPMLLSLTVAGIDFAGADVGGFFGNPPAELAVRWYQAASFQPFFRGHAHIDTLRREPWIFGEPYTTYIRDAIRRRYMYLPTIYTVFFDSWWNGNAIMRPLMFEFPQDERTWALEDAYMLGSAILVKPVVQPSQDKIEVYLPGNEAWFDLDTLRRFTPGHHSVRSPITKLPHYLRSGSIVTLRERVRRSSSVGLADPISLIVAVDSAGSASGELFFDDGLGYDFLKGGYAYIRMTMQNGKLTGSQVRLEGKKSSSSDVAAKLRDVIISESKDISLDSSTQFQFLAKFNTVRVERLKILGIAGRPKSISTVVRKRYSLSGGKVSVENGKWEKDCEFVVETPSKGDGEEATSVVVKEPGIKLTDLEWEIFVNA